MNTPEYIKPGGFGRCRNGCKARFYATNAGGDHPVHGAVECKPGVWFMNAWTPHGRWSKLEDQYGLDIIGPWVEPLDFDWKLLPPGWWGIAMCSDNRWVMFEKDPGSGYGIWAPEAGDCCQVPPHLHPTNYTGDWKSSATPKPTQ